MRTDKNVDDFAEDWLDIGSLNKGEDDRLKERERQLQSIGKDIEDWDDYDKFSLFMLQRLRKGKLGRITFDLR